MEILELCCIFRGKRYRSVKIVNVHPKNPERHRLPTVMATIVLLNPKNGTSVCIMDGPWITAMRTGGTGGIAIKYLARKDAKSIGIVGDGIQAKTQLMVIKKILPDIEEVKVADKFIEQSRKYAGEMRKN